MSRLIDADALLAEILEKPNIRYSNLDLIKTIGDSQTVDAVPVVHCRDCKYCYAEGFVNVRNVCEKHNDFGNVDDDWFCADGKRR